MEVRAHRARRTARRAAAAARPLRGGGRGAGARCGRGGGEAACARASPSAPVLLPAATLRARGTCDGSVTARRSSVSSGGRRVRSPGVAARCALGGPSVIAQRPYDETGTPFPTTFWLSCRVLVRAVGELESGGGIARARGASSPRGRDCGRAARRADARVAAAARGARARRPAADGGAALRRASTAARPRAPLKCLHAHAAVALGAPPYAFGRARARARAARRLPGELLRVGVSELSVRLAREDWRAGERAVERVLADPARAPIAAQRDAGARARAAPAPRADLHARRARARSTTTPTAGRATRPSASRPASAGPRTASFADAACARAARNARDWTPG